METIKKALLISLITLLLPITSWAADMPADTNEDIDRVAAVVNEEIITFSQIDDQLGNVKQKMLMSGQDIPSDDIIRKKVLDMMINKSLQMQIAKRNNMHVENDDVNAAVERIAKTNHVSLERLHSEMKKEGVNIKQFRRDLKEQLLIQQVQQRTLASKVSVTDKEAQDFVEKMAENKKGPQLYHLANILISLPESPSSTEAQIAQNKADAIVAKLKKGADFNKIASSDSDGDHALTGGDLGWRKLAAIPSLFAGELKTMKSGDVRGPLRAPNGIHIIKLLGAKQDIQTPDLNRVKAMIYQRKMSEQVQQWLQQVRDSAYIKIYM